MQWRGAVFLKYPLDYCIYQLMIQEIKPATIIEIGTFNGGGTLWLADTAKAHCNNTHVYTMDYDLSNLQPIVHERDDITVIKGDCYKIEEALTSDLLKVNADFHVLLYRSSFAKSRKTKYNNQLRCNKVKNDVEKKIQIICGQKSLINCNTLKCISRVLANGSILSSFFKAVFT